MAQQNNTIFLRVSQNKGVVDFSRATPQLKFEICKLTIESILGILQDNFESTIPEPTLNDFAYSLLQISNVLYELHRGLLGTRYQFMKLRVPIDNARLHLNAALSISKKEDRLLQRAKYILNCRNNLEKAIDVIKGFDFDLSENGTSEVILPTKDRDTTAFTPTPTTQPTASSPSPKKTKSTRKKRATNPSTSAPPKAEPALEEELFSEYGIEVEQVPRVLNANFADLVQHRVLEPDESLVAEREYDLLVDVGPRWITVKSLVTGLANFPEVALPPDQDGYVVQVVIVSEDFTPGMVSAQIWVPRRTGSSYPFENGQRTDQAGPVALRLRTPKFPLNSNTEAIPTRARLCLYYENNLLQSAVVKVGVTAVEGTKLEEENTIEVDYVLTGTFQELEERYAKRTVQFTQMIDAPTHPVTLNLTLNDDGADGHRIIISHLIGNNMPFIQPQQVKCPPRGWTTYDPEAAKEWLVESRNQLQSVFYQKDKNKANLVDEKNHPRPLNLIKLNNGKTREQFMDDLLDLAKLGSKLYDRVFNRVNPEGSDCTSNDWKRDLEESLTRPCVIQVARTSKPHNYIFPWALLYSYPISSDDNKDLEYCSIINEWSENGIRHTPLSEKEAKERSTCRYHFEEWHSSNVICPYGFWGLKHIIEQPPSVENNKSKDTWNYIQTDAKLGLSLGVTRDSTLDSISINDHLAKLQHIDGLYIKPSLPAEDWPGVCSILTAPEIVYFLCHGEYDAKEHMTYLRVGPPAKLLDSLNPSGIKIYPWALDAWARERPPKGPNSEEWKKRHPLIFINGCHTVDLKPGEVLDFVSSFIDMGASGVLGTEVNVLLPVATEVAESLFVKLANGKSVGQALYEIRWDLVNKGNLLGLAYTLYGLADLRALQGEKIKRDQLLHSP